MNAYYWGTVIVIAGLYLHHLINKIRDLEDQMDAATEMIMDLSKALKDYGYDKVEYHG